ncbi:SGNH/GDSL hydrolase family protein [Nocardia sp. CDC159]|uniref:SGNH/GDSL hydrolase family protein n=1 Tax=Nocardia pulmonis TaxID=2951408 RepID=A0A9X2J016_9NOCA|nr:MULTISPECIES: SGNH/GDSL hydrolase family protein [Nocardia]MCM6778013.1 SGNH/GDSL hydrolase family protein [Nocardia pulmonis]MCM6790816.1 SGNH/GDSL hydrolase family protein [Nocardia sp. CDC159]
MAYSKQTWADSPATTSPLSAARLNHIEDGIFEAVPQNPSRTMTLPYSNGGLGGTVATTLAAGTAGSYRFVVKLPVTTTQWRIKLRNQEYTAGTKTAATLKKLIVGKHARATTGTAGETGNFLGNTATTIVSTDQTIPGNGTWYTSPWVTAAGDQFTADTEHLIGIGYTFAASTSLQTSCGRSWFWTNSTSGTDPTIAGSGGTQQYVPFDWVIEYQCTTRRKVALVIGDSISEGITGTNSALQSTSLWHNPFWLWAARSDRLIVNLSLAGVGLVHYATSPATNYLWTRQDINSGAYTIDEIIISAGSNDFNTSRTLAQMQADVLTIVSYLTTTLGLTAPIYMATLLARGTTGDAVRLTYHDWLAEVPTFAQAEVIDFDGATRGTSTTAIWPQYESDSIHPSRLGTMRMATELHATLG